MSGKDAFAVSGSLRRPFAGPACEVILALAGNFRNGSEAESKDELAATLPTPANAVWLATSGFVPGTGCETRGTFAPEHH
jgi:hypothetical protein